MIRNLIAAAAFALMMSCAAFAKVSPYLPPPDDMACIADDAEHGVKDPMVFIADCHLVEVAVADVERFIHDYFQAKARIAANRRLRMTADGGAP